MSKSVTMTKDEQGNVVAIEGNLSPDAIAAQRAPDSLDIRRARVLAERQGRYQSESDPLYLESVYDGSDLQLWRDKVAEIKSDLPLPTV